MSSQTTVGTLSVELGLSDEQFRQALAHAQVQAEQAGRKMQTSINAATSAGPRGMNSQGLLNISRAIDDVQYGFRGVINNIEGIVTGLGFGAGVAGAATIAGVALAAIVPKIAAIATAVDPMKDLSANLKQISESGIGGTFWGIADSARATDAAYKAALSTLKEMKVQTQQIAFASGGPGMAAPGAMQAVGNTAAEIFAQQFRTNELGRRAARLAFDASRGQEAFTAGALAGNVETEGEQDRRRINQEIFKAAVEKMGGGQQLFDALQAKNPGSPNLFGEFQRGDSKASDEAVFRLRLEAEKSKVIADSFERATGAMAEINRIEDAKTKKQMQEEGRWFDKSISAFEKQETLRGRRESLLNSMRRSEIIGAADVFGRNLNAGMKSEELKQLEEINKGIQDLKPITGLG